MTQVIGCLVGEYEYIEYDGFLIIFVVPPIAYIWIGSGVYTVRKLFNGIFCGLSMWYHAFLSCRSGSRGVRVCCLCLY